MSESHRIKSPRISYWAGAIIGSLVLIPMLSPKVANIAYGIPNFNPGSDYRYAIYIAASLMPGWVSLLIWADRKSVERRSVLLLTIFPVLTGLIIFGIFAVTSNLIPINKMLPTWIVQGMLVLLFGFSYLIANKLDVWLHNSRCCPSTSWTAQANISLIRSSYYIMTTTG